MPVDSEASYGRALAAPAAGDAPHWAGGGTFSPQITMSGIAATPKSCLQRPIGWMHAGIRDVRWPEHRVIPEWSG
jgi:hypothetical protein